MTANSQRGEVALRLDGEREIVLKPEIGIICKIEDRAGRSLGQMGNLGLKFREALIILEEAGGVKAAEAARLLRDYGIGGQIGSALGDFIVNAILGGISAEERKKTEDAEKNPDAAEGTSP